MKYANRECVQCGEVKPYFYNAPHYRKASGFHGAKCWACYIKNSSARGRGQSAESTEAELSKGEQMRQLFLSTLNPEQRAKFEELHTKHKSTPSRNASGKARDPEKEREYSRRCRENKKAALLAPGGYPAWWDEP